MEHKIIADSCCDMTPQLRERLGVVSVPLFIRLGEKEFIDDSTLDLDGFIDEMKCCTEKVGSASPPPSSYQKAMEDAQDSFVITLSSQLSGSYTNAMLGKSLAEENDGVDVHVFDSKSASAGELLIAVKLRELLKAEWSKEHIVQEVSHFIDDMKTYFVLDRYDNLQNNGRLNKVVGKFISVLGIKLVMGSDKDGNIALYEKARGTNQILEKLFALIRKSGKQTEGENMVITHCNNWELANQLMEVVKRQFHFKEIFVVPTGGLSSLYTDDKGVVMAF